MAMCLITYDLRAPDRDYETLFKAIEALGDTCRPLESVWIVASGFSAQAVKDKLAPHLDSNDQLLVVEVSKCTWSTRNLSKESSSWFNRMSPSS